MAGSPDCPVKIEERRNITKQLATPNYSKQEQTTYSSITKNSNMFSKSPTTHLLSINSNQKQKTNTDITPTIVNELDLIMSKINQLVDEQEKITMSIHHVHQRINMCRREISLMNELMVDKVCPYVIELSETFIGKNKQPAKEKIQSLLNRFKHDVKQTTTSISSYKKANICLHDFSLNESVYSDI